MERRAANSKNLEFNGCVQEIDHRVEKGQLIEFRVQGERRLAVLDRPEGKKNWVAIDEVGQSRTLTPKQISYIVEGQTYKSSEIASFRQDVKTYLDPSSLEVAWEILIDDSAAVDPQEMAELLFSDRSPPPCYAAHCMLCEDKIYFKNKGDRYEPRSSSQVAELKHQIEVEHLRKREWQDFLEKVRQALTAGSGKWNERDRLRLEVVERFAALGEDAPHRAGATELLQTLERPATPPAAFDLLVDLGLWNPYENLFLRRAGLPTYFSSQVLDVAQCCLKSPPPDPETNRLDLTHLKIYTIDDAST
ncbi:RNB domain-containing ribonuclease, partial [Oscillatoriales cyanobacterium LEGE 11467]|nr:RNB domain-containing ribonuclease [Zarconia navalis LEGE 11467]